MTSHISSPTVYTMKFKSGLGTETQSLYLGTENGLLRVPTSRCMRFKSRNQCLSSGDPYCGWNTRSQSCTVAPNHNPGATWEQSSSGFSCPDTNIQVSYINFFIFIIKLLIIIIARFKFFFIFFIDS